MLGTNVAFNSALSGRWSLRDDCKVLRCNLKSSERSSRCAGRVQPGVVRLVNGFAGARDGMGRVPPLYTRLRSAALYK